MKHSLLCLLLVLFLSSCAETVFLAHLTKQIPESSTTQFKVGNPYKIAGKTYTPKESYTHKETGIASWYGPNFHGKMTANGETYDMYALTAAHRTLQIPSIVKVTNLENGRSIKVRINDRGPFAHERVIDMSKRGAELLGFLEQGTARVRVEVLPLESQIVAQAAKEGKKINVNETLRLARLYNKEKATKVASNDVLASSNGVRGEPLTLSNKQEMDILQKQAEPFQSVTTVNPVEVETLSPSTPLELADLPSTKNTDSFSELMDTVSEKDATDHINDVEVEAVKPSNLFIQAGSFSSKDNAYKLADRIKKYGNTSVQEALVNDRTFYRVRVGPLDTVNVADETLAKMWQEQHLQDSRIIVD